MTTFDKEKWSALAKLDKERFQREKIEVEKRKQIQSTQHHLTLYKSIDEVIANDEQLDLWNEDNFRNHPKDVYNINAEIEFDSEEEKNIYHKYLFKSFSQHLINRIMSRAQPGFIKIIQGRHRFNVGSMNKNEFFSFCEWAIQSSNGGVLPFQYPGEKVIKGYVPDHGINSQFDYQSIFWTGYNLPLFGTSIHPENGRWNWKKMPEFLSIYTYRSSISNLKLRWNGYNHTINAEFDIEVEKFYDGEWNYV